MGMTDKQFAGYLRFLLRDLKEALEAEDPKYREQKLKEMIDDIQKTIED